MKLIPSFVKEFISEVYLDMFNPSRIIKSSRYFWDKSSNANFSDDSAQKRIAKSTLGLAGGVGLGAVVLISAPTIAAALFAPMALPLFAANALFAPWWAGAYARTAGAGISLLNYSRRAFASLLPASVTNKASSITAQVTQPVAQIAARVTAPVSKLAANKTLSTQFDNAIAAPKAVAAKLTPKLHLPHLPKL